MNKTLPIWPECCGASSSKYQSPQKEGGQQTAAGGDGEEVKEEAGLTDGEQTCGTVFISSVFLAASHLLSLSSSFHFQTTVG